MSIPPNYPPPGPLGATDPKRWLLDTSDDGRVRWTYQASEGTAQEQTDEAKYWLGLDLKLPALPDPEENPLHAARNGFEFYKRLQSPDGHWSGEYGGPMFLIPGFVITWYITKTPIPQEWRVEITRYLANYQRRGGKADQGWGLHIEGVSTVFGTAMNYVACRILGVGPDEPMMVRARNTLHELGGTTGVPSWGKFWLSLLNVYSWEGNNPIPPELWLLPEFVPIHPSRWWAHVRWVYIPMGYFYGRKFAAPEDDLIRSLRHELYAEPYESIDWPRCRNKIAKVDLYAPHHPVADALFPLLAYYERFVPKWLRNAGVDRAYELIVYEDANTSCQGLGPVNGPLNMLARWDREGPESEAFKTHQQKRHDFMWMSKEGMMVTGTNGSQLWDLSFISQALVETGLAEDKANRDSAIRALEWLDRCQIRDNPKYYKEAHRHMTRGAWPFSTREQGYTVSDCTAEGLKAVLYLQNELSYTPELVSQARMCDAVDVILSLQNPGGGFASYELIRGSAWLEWLNPAEVFANIMIEYAYPECTTACLTALTLFQRFNPQYRKADIDRVRAKAVKYIHNSQRPDGSWFGSWAICFTYATMFALESLALNGETYKSSERVRRACDFLLRRQMADGGWGESYKACETGQYVHHSKSQVVNTSWAVIALLTAKYPDKEPVVRGCRLIMSRQKPNGEWPQEAIEGIFNKSTAISYPNYKFSWTIWALGKAYRELPSVQW